MAAKPALAGSIGRGAKHSISGFFGRLGGHRDVHPVRAVKLDLAVNRADFRGLVEKFFGAHDADNVWGGPPFLRQTLRRGGAAASCAAGTGRL